MDIMELGAIGELVGGVAVVASLLYVGVQMKQTNQLTRAQVRRETSRDSTEIAAGITRDDMELMLRGSADLDSLSVVDRSLYILRFTAGVNYYETLFYAKERGEVDDDLWESRLHRMRGTFALFLPLWSMQKETFGRRFVEFIDAEVIPRLSLENLFVSGEPAKEGS